MSAISDNGTPAGKTAVVLSVNGTGLVPSLKEAEDKLNGARDKAILDFTAVHRVDAPALQVLEEFARLADEKAIKIVLRGVSVEVYKVLKLTKLTQRFSFVN